MKILNKKNIKLNQILLLEYSVLCSTAYKNYPIEIIENKEYTIIIEGVVYNLNKEELYEQLKIHSREIYHIEKYSIIQEWLLKLSGDFIIYFIRKEDGEIAILNDTLGRLPLYIGKINDYIIVTREIGILKNIIKITEIDRVALAEVVFLGYTLGNKTVLKGIEKVAPATIIRINSKKRDYSSKIIFEYNFERKVFLVNTINDNAKMLAEKFTEVVSCLKNNNILSLSGGLDSRSVAFALMSAGQEFKTITFKEYSNQNISDVDYAKQIAIKINKCWELIELEEKNKISKFNELYATKSVYTSYAVSHLVEFLEKIRKKNGDRNYFITGDGGDKVIPDLRPGCKFKNITSLAKYVAFKNGLMPYRIIEKMFNLPKDFFIKEIEKLLMSYPEKNYKQKYKHFMIFERGRNWLFEGEDRNRYYFWQVSPFYNQSFFSAAMECPDVQKSNYQLYTQFIRELSSSAYNIGYPDLMGTKLGSKAQKRISFFMNILFSSKTMLGTYRRFKNICNNVRSMKSLNEIRKMFKYVKKSRYINIERLKKIVNSRQYMNYINLCNLFTINSLINEFNNDKGE